MQKSTGIPYRDVIETAVQSLGLRDVAEFDIDKKVIGLPTFDGPLVNKQVTEFVDEVSRETPAPGGGSIAALAGSLGAALAAMVANLSIGKPEFDSKFEELNSLAEKRRGSKINFSMPLMKTRKRSMPCSKPCASQKTRRSSKPSAARHWRPATSTRHKCRCAPPSFAAMRSIFVSLPPKLAIWR
jgi:hypothetical protein